MDKPAQPTPDALREWLLERITSCGMATWSNSRLTVYTQVLNKLDELERREFSQDELRARFNAMRTSVECKECRPQFDVDAARGLPAKEVRKRWPRFHGECEACGYKGIKYASPEHFVLGDY